MEDGASSTISKRHQKRSISDSDSISSAPLKQSASSSSGINDQTKISYISFQAANGDRDDEFRMPLHPSYQQENDTLLSVVNPHLCHRLNKKLCNSTNYWSQQESFLSLDHTKLLDEAARISKANEKYPDFSRISATFGEKPSRIKTRLKWTADLHEKFVGCVNLLGGAENATPSAILRLMKSNGLALHHVKSHLQKYRHAKWISDSRKENIEEGIKNDDLYEIKMKSGGMQIKEMLEMQAQVQTHLCQQLQIQQNLQQAIEKQGKQIQFLFEQLKKKAN
ncbi:hypothetical protein V6N13_025126 [Hibiscus sabdariffa]|uniref:Myb-like domain-containing protein n=1 Tax=Hibiscus sabdariffa TaxID=183260 RepID=A0ABR2NM98_9ROSI